MRPTAATSIRLAVRLLLVAASWFVWPFVWLFATIFLGGYVGIVFADQCAVDECGPPTPPLRNALESVGWLLWFAVLVVPPVLVTWRWWRWRRAYRPAASLHGVDSKIPL